MSFQTFCGQDPDDEVSYQKVLPRFLPENASSSVIRIDTAGQVAIPEPKIKNESLFVIDTASLNATFTYTPIGLPSGVQQQGGLIPFVNPTDPLKVGYLMFSWKFAGDSPPAYTYALLSWLDPAGGWNVVAETNQNAVISTICNVNANYTDGGKPLQADTFLIAGNFTTFGGVACASGYATYDPQNNAIAAYAIGTALPDPTDLPKNMISLPAQFGGGFMAMFANPANYKRIARLQGGAWSAIAPNTGMDATDKNGINKLCFDEPNGVLLIGGSFTAFDVNGAAAPNSAGIVCLAWDNGNNDWRTNVPLPSIQPLFAYNAALYVDDIRLAFDPNEGFFVIGSFENATSTGCFFCKNIGQPILPIAIPTTAINIAGMFIIGYDNENWVGANSQRCFGEDAGGQIITFGQGAIAGWAWYYDAPIATKPLSYLGDVGFGSFQAGVETTLDFTAANLRYCKDNGVSGLATSVVLTSAYASIFLLGDTISQPPVWDMVSYTGILKYTP